MQLDRSVDPPSGAGADLGMTDDPATLLGDTDFALVRRLIADYAGIKLSPQKRNMA